jgi:hypothetical protein
MTEIDGGRTSVAHELVELSMEIETQHTDGKSTIFPQMEAML